MSSRAVSLAVGLLLRIAHGQDIRAVMIVGDEIYTKSQEGRILQLTNDGVPKALPVWSKDGLQIAFVEPNNPVGALGTLIVIASDGYRTSETILKPYIPGQERSGMRFIERLEWLTNNTIALSGSVNPSTTEYNIVDLTNRNVPKEFFDDGLGAGFSPDGRHFAYVTGAPHFTPSHERAPALNVDGRTVLIGQGGEIEFTEAPRWSADNSYVAVLVSLMERQQVVVWHGGRSASVVSLPASPKRIKELSWVDEDLYAISESSARGNSDWRLPHGDIFAQWEPADAARVLTAREKARTLRSLIEKSIQESGGRNPDVWCSECELLSLPRRSEIVE